MWKKKSARGGGRITYKALCKLDYSYRSAFLDIFNSAWRTGVLP